MVTNCNLTQMLTRYNAWANKLIFGAVAKLPSGEEVKNRKSIFGNMVYTLSHIYVVDLIWQAHLEGREHGFTERNFKDCPTLEELWIKQQKIDQWYISWSDNVPSNNLEKKLKCKLIGGNECMMTPTEILLHVVNHTTYHRGFVADMFYQIPVKPPATDLSVFLQQDWTRYGAN